MKVCARPGCGRSLEKLRADAVWCSNACRREVSRMGGFEALDLLQGARAFWHHYGQVRRGRNFRRAAA